jgi:RecA-family ATPase
LLQRYSYVLESNKQTIIPENVENGYYIACNTLEKGLKQAIQQFRKEIADMPKSTIKSQLWGVPSVKEALSTFTDENSKFIASIVGDGGIGKTSLVSLYLIL